MTTNNSRNIFHNINNVSRKSVSSDKPNQQKVLTMTNNNSRESFYIYSRRKQGQR